MGVVPLFAGLAEGLKKKQLGLRNIKLTPATSYRVPPGEYVIILGGAISHITGTDSDVSVYSTPSTVGSNLLFIATVDTGEGNDTYPLFNNNGAHGAQWSPFILREPNIIYFGGGSGGYVNLQLLVVMS